MKQIKNGVYRLKKAVEVAKGISLPALQELEIVQDVVYVNGNMVPPEAQALFYSFILNNSTLFENDTRSW